MAISTSSPSGFERAFSFGDGVKLQLLNYRILSGETSGTVTADALKDIKAILLDNQVKFSAAPTFSGNVATLAFVVPAETAAELAVQDITYTAVADLGQDGNNITIAYLDTATPVAASLIEQDLTFTAKSVGTPGNAVTITYSDTATPVASSLIEQDLTYTAVTPGTYGDTITIKYTAGGTAGSEGVAVVGKAITVTMDATPVTGSTAAQIKTAIDGFPAAAALVTVAVSGTGTNVQSDFTPAHSLTGGDDDCTSSASGTDITVVMADGVTPASVIKSAVEADGSSDALVSIAVSGTASNPQNAVSQTPLAGGLDDISVTVSGNAISVSMANAVSTAQMIFDVVSVDASVIALVTPVITGTAGNAQNAAAADNLAGGVTGGSRGSILCIGA